MEKPNKLVGVVSNVSGGCEYVAVVKNIKPSEYATLLKEQRQQEQTQAREKRELLDRVSELETQVANLVKEIKVLKGEDEYEESVED